MVKQEWLVGGLDQGRFHGSAGMLTTKTRCLCVSNSLFGSRAEKSHFTSPALRRIFLIRLTPGYDPAQISPGLDKNLNGSVLEKPIQLWCMYSEKGAGERGSSLHTKLTASL